MFATKFNFIALSAGVFTIKSTPLAVNVLPSVPLSQKAARGLGAISFLTSNVSVNRRERIAIKTFSIKF